MIRVLISLEDVVINILYKQEVSENISEGLQLSISEFGDSSP